MGQSHFASAAEQRRYNRSIREENAREEAENERRRNELAAKITMAAVDKIVNEIIRPGPRAEERECYEMAGELREIVPTIEKLVRQIIDVEGVLLSPQENQTADRA